MADKNDQPQFQLQEVKMGVGDAIKRLVVIEFQIRQGLSSLPEATLAERDMIHKALNQFELSLGFDCNMDGQVDAVADDVGIFEMSAATSCCRLLPPSGKVSADNSRKPPKKKGASTSRKKSSSLFNRTKEKK